MAPETDLTDMIHRMQRGDRSAGDSVFIAAASRLRKIAVSLMRREDTNGFNASDLVQETFAQKLSGNRLKAKVQNREHFFSLVAAGMRQVLADRGRGRSARKRQALPVEQLLMMSGSNPCLLDLAIVLARLQSIDPSGARLIALKYQHGMSWEELAESSGHSVWRVRAECEYILGWLRTQLQ